MTEEFIVTDRYGDGARPDPSTMCKGQCDGMGCYPHKEGDRDETPEERKRWLECHNVSDAHKDEKDGVCDGWHFIQCPDCNGTGKMEESDAGRD